MPDTNVPPALPAVTAALQARYRDGAPPTAAWNAVIESLLGHRSVRAYSSEPLPPGTLEAMVAAAQSASTSSNLQVWSVVAVEDQGRRDRLSVLGNDQKHIREAPLFLCWVADLSRASRLGAAHGAPMEALPFLETFMVAVVDAALAAQNAVVAAESLGLGTVYIGGMRNHPEQVAAELHLPENAFVVFGLCVGHVAAGASPSVKPRLPQSAILHRERYDTAADAGISRFDATLKAFQAEQGMASQGWSELVRSRLGRIASMSGRDRMKAALSALGLELR